MKIYIVWNEDRTEGVVFTDEEMATATAHRKLGDAWSPLGEAFANDIYEAHALTLERVELDQ